MREALVPTLLAFSLLLAGCLGGGDSEGASVEPASAAPLPTHVLANATEPAGLDAPTFALAGMVGKAGPAYGAGEPAVWAGLDGTVYLAFPGCDRDPGPGFLLPVRSRCPVGVVQKSVDGGMTWTRLNDEESGELAEGAEAANGDADVAVDAAGVVYVSNLGDGIPVQKSMDGGGTWVDLGNPVPEGSRGVDRNWMAAAGPGHVVLNWMGGPKNEARQVGIVTTWDGGGTWTAPTYVGDNIGWLGTPQFAPDGRTVYVPFTEPETDDGLLFGGSLYRLFVARSDDGGANWTVLDTNTTVARSQTSFHFSGLLMAPTLDVTGDGTVVYAYSEEVPLPGGVLNGGSRVKLIASKDGGMTWSAPVQVSETPNAIMPWVTGGAGDRVAITYMASPLPGDPDRVGVWDVMATVVDGVGGDAPEMVTSLIDEMTHQGGACTQGGACFLTGSDRALLDYFEADLMPDGRLVVVYPADPLQGGKYIEIRVAVQEGGSPLLSPRVAGRE